LSLLESHSEATGTIHHAIAVIYAVLAAFAVIVVWEQINAAQATTQREASDLEDIYRLATQLPASDRQQTQELARSYARAVVEEEWPLMRDGQASPHAQTLVDELRGSIEKFEPHTVADQAVYTRMLTRVGELDENRALRLLASHEGIPILVWMALVVGGIITIGFTYLFGMEAPRLHMVRVAALTTVVVLLLYTINHIEKPFAGDVRVGPDALEMVLDRIEVSSERRT
jgi:hypothetical protein